MTASSNSEGLDILAELKQQLYQAKKECISKRWKYTRKSGETLVFRDLFDKIAKWVDIFKQVGDCAVVGIARVPFSL